MTFKREWDSTCPRVYDRWEERGVTWVIQDLPPEDDEEAVKILVEHLIPDETLCIINGMAEDPVSQRSMAEYWRECLSRRMSLACYAVADGEKTLAAVNCCVVQCADDKDEYPEPEGEAWKNVYNAVSYVERKLNAYEMLNLDKLLYAMGLVVRRQYRGAKLGAKMLSAREPLSLSQGIKGTHTVFTGVASQKSAARAGFTTALEVSITELGDAGLGYPRDDRVIKLMVKKFAS